MSLEPGRTGAVAAERELREAFERYERDLPMTAVHVEAAGGLGAVGAADGVGGWAVEARGHAVVLSGGG